MFNLIQGISFASIISYHVRVNTFTELAVAKGWTSCAIAFAQESKPKDLCSFLIFQNPRGKG